MCIKCESSLHVRLHLWCERENVSMSRLICDLLHRFLDREVQAPTVAESELIVRGYVMRSKRPESTDAENPEPSPASQPPEPPPQTMEEQVPEPTNEQELDITFW